MRNTRSVSQLAHHYRILIQDSATRQVVGQGTRKQNMTNVICIVLSILAVSRLMHPFQIRLFLDTSDKALTHR